MKKKSWFNLFIKRWIPLLVVAGIISVVVTDFVTRYYFDTEYEFCNDMVYARSSGLQTNMEEWLEAEGEEKEVLETRIQFELRLSSNVLYDADFSVWPQGAEDEMILGCKKGPGERISFYSCPIEYFKQTQPDECYEAVTYYIKDTQFLPGLTYRVDIETGESIEEIDLTPQNTKGYEYIDKRDYPDEPIMTFLYYLSFPTIPDDVEKYFADGYQHSDIVDDVEESTYWNYECYTCSEIILSDNSKFYLISNYSIDLWLLSKAYLIPFYVGIFIFSTMLAAIWALRNYKNDQMLSYQKNLTRALAHDLKSPLMVISGYAQNLSEHICPEKEEYYAKAIVENVEDMSQTITDILELSRLQDQKKGLKRTKQSVDALIQEMIGHYKDVLSERRQEIVVTGDTTINCDAMLMKRVFDNLISNAIYHSEEESKITIEISEKKLVISNPVSEEVGNKKEQLLEPFEKGDESRKQPHGTGIGLSIAKSILKMHKYSIKIEYKEKTFVAILVFGKKKF